MKSRPWVLKASSPPSHTVSLEPGAYGNAQRTRRLLAHERCFKRPLQARESESGGPSGRIELTTRSLSLASDASTLKQRVDRLGSGSRTHAYPFSDTPGVDTIRVAIHELQDLKLAFLRRNPLTVSAACGLPSLPGNESRAVAVPLGIRADDASLIMD